MRVSDLIPGFVDELEKLASEKKAFVGAALGGLVGYHMGGPSNASKLLNTAAGAGVGHLAGKVVGGLAGGAKRGVWDEPRARAHRDLYGYQPSTVTNPEDYQQQ